MQEDLEIIVVIENLDVELVLLQAIIIKKGDALCKPSPAWKMPLNVYSTRTPYTPCTLERDWITSSGATSSRCKTV